MAEAPENDAGQALPFVIMLVLVAIVLSVAVGAVGRLAIDRSRTQAAADAIALAVVAGDDGVDVAAANGVELQSVQIDGNRAVVVVTAGRVNATAAAELVPGRDVDGFGKREDLAPAMLAALARADQLLGRAVPVTSGYRSPEDQLRLWRNRHLNPYPVARPGTSRHEKGLAVDVPSWFVPRLLAVAADAGLCQPLPDSDPIHFEICGTR